MSGGEGRKLSNQDIELVQNRITQCLEHYMNKKEIVNTLIIQGNIEPCITELVWQRLEEENHEFFMAYYLKLLVKEQIMEFNRLLSEQVDLMCRTGFSGIITSFLPSNGSPTQHVCPAKGEKLQQAGMLNNCGSAAIQIQSCLEGRSIIDGCVVSRKMDVCEMGLSEIINGKSVKTEGGYGNGNGGSNDLESGGVMGDEAQAQQHPWDGDGFWAQMAQTFPELGADLATGSGLLFLS